MSDLAEYRRERERALRTARRFALALAWASAAGWLLGRVAGSLERGLHVLVAGLGRGAVGQIWPELVAIAAPGVALALAAEAFRWRSQESKGPAGPLRTPEDHVRAVVRALTPRGGWVRGWSPTAVAGMVAAVRPDLDGGVWPSIELRDGSRRALEQQGVRVDDLAARATFVGWVADPSLVVAAWDRHWARALGEARSRASRRDEVWISNEQSLLVLGPPRSGKNLTLFNGLVARHDGPAVVTGARGDLVDALGPVRAQLGPVVVLDPEHQVRWSGARGAWIDLWGPHGEALAALQRRLVRLLEARRRIVAAQEGSSGDRHVQAFYEREVARLTAALLVLEREAAAAEERVADVRAVLATLNRVAADQHKALGDILSEVESTVSVLKARAARAGAGGVIDPRWYHLAGPRTSLGDWLAKQTLSVLEAGTLRGKDEVALGVLRRAGASDAAVVAAVLAVGEHRPLPDAILDALRRWGAAAGTNPVVDDAIEILRSLQAAADPTYWTYLVGFLDGVRELLDGEALEVTTPHLTIDPSGAVVELAPEHWRERLDLEALLEAGGTLFAIGSAAVQRRLGPLVAGVLEELLTRTVPQRIARSGTARLAPPLGLMLDEFVSLAPLPPELVTQVLTTGAGSGVRYVLVVQSLSLVEAAYSSAIAEGIKATAGYVAVLPGLDVAAARWVAERVGSELAQVAAAAKDGEDPAASTSALELVTPDLVTRLPADFSGSDRFGRWSVALWLRGGGVPILVELPAFVDEPWYRALQHL